MAPPTPTIDIIRHAEALHNILGSHIRDPPLTAAGRAQCRQLARVFPQQYAPPRRVAHVVASPLRRTIETALAVFAKSVLSAADAEAEVEAEAEAGVDGEAAPSLLPLPADSPEANFEQKNGGKPTAGTTKAKTIPKTKAKKTKAQKKLILLPEIQEVSPYPSSTGSAPDALRAAYGDDALVDWAGLSPPGPRWYRKSPDTPFAPDAAKVEARARKARVWLRELARTTVAAAAASTAPGGAASGAGPDATTTDGDGDGDGDGGMGDDDDGAAHIVVVTHGEFVHWLTGDFAGVGRRHNTGWWNAECRSFRFADLGGDDGEAALVETARSRDRRRHFSVQPLGPVENAQAKELAMGRLREYAADMEIGVSAVDGEGEGRGEEDEEWEDV